MRQIKKIQALLMSLLIIMALSGVPAPVFADPLTMLRVMPATNTLTTCPGAELELTIRVEDVVALTAYHLEIDFTPGAVEVLEVRNGTFLSDGFMEPTNWIDQSNGKILFGMAQIQGDGISSSGDLVYIRMKAITPFVGVNFEVDAVNSILVNWPEALPIPFQVASGVVHTLPCVTYSCFLPLILR